MGKPSIKYHREDDFLPLEASMAKDLANAYAAMDVNNRAIGNTGKIYDLFDGTNDWSSGLMDTTSTTITSAYSSGVTAMNVASTTGFAAGREVTIYDGSGSEDKIIASIGSGVLNFTTGTTNAYASGAKIARSSAVVNGGKLDFGGGTFAQTFTRTPGVAIYTNGSMLDQRSNGETIVVAPNGTLYTVTSFYNGTNSYLIAYKSTNGGGSWTDISFPNATPYTYTNGNPTLVVDASNNLHAVWHGTDATYAAQQIKYAKYNGTSWGATSYITTYTGYGQNAPAITIDSLGYLHVVWFGTRSGQATLQIQYSKSTNGGTSWSTPVYVSQNTSYLQASPDIYVDSSNYLHVVFNGPDASNVNRQIKYCRSVDNGASWSSWVNLSVVTGYDQNQPRVAAKNAVVCVTWNGNNATNPSYAQVKTITSTNNGTSWGSRVDVTTGSTQAEGYPAVTFNNSGHIYLLWHSAIGYYLRQSISTNNGASWAAYTQPAINGTAVYPNACKSFGNFTDPLLVFNNSSSNFEFRGIFTGSATVSLTTSVARYNITPPLGTTTQLAMWVQKERSTPDTDFSISASTSIVGAGANESYTAMTKTTNNFSAGTAEEAFTMTPLTAGAKTTFKLNLTRTSSAIAQKVTKLMGGVY